MQDDSWGTGRGAPRVSEQVSGVEPSCRAPIPPWRKCETRQRGYASRGRMLEPLAIVQGMMGLRTWLAEVQILISKLKQRCMTGMTL